MTTTDYVDEQISNYSNPPGATGPTGPSGPMSSVSIVNEWVSTANIESGAGYYLSSMTSNGTVLVTSTGSNLQVWQLSNENWTMSSSFTLPISGCVSISALESQGYVFVAVGLPNYNTGLLYDYGYYWNGDTTNLYNDNDPYSGGYIFGCDLLTASYIGIVQVFQFAQTSGWVQFGQNIETPPNGGGTSFFYPPSGFLPQSAPATPPIYSSIYYPDTYTPPPNTLFGTSVNLSATSIGISLGVGAPGYTFPNNVNMPQTGVVLLYKYNDNAWQANFTQLDYYAPEYFCGYSYVDGMSFSNNQQTAPPIAQATGYSLFSTNSYSCSLAISNELNVVFGAYGADSTDTTDDPGSTVTPFESVVVTPNLNPVGQAALNATNYNPYSSSTAAAGFGLSVSISGTGNIFAVGAPYAVPNESSPTFTGAVNIYTNSTLLATLNAPIPNTQFGYAVALSADGSLCAIAAPPYYIYFYKSYGKGYFPYGSPIVLPTPMYTTSSTTLSETFAITCPLCLSDDGLTISVLDVNGQVYIYNYQRMIIQAV